MSTFWRQIINQDASSQTRIELKTGSDGKGLKADCEPCLPCNFRECSTIDDLGVAAYQQLIDRINERAKNCRQTFSIYGNLTLLDRDVCYTLSFLITAVNRVIACAPWVDPNLPEGEIIYTSIPPLSSSADYAALNAKLDDLTAQRAVGTILYEEKSATYTKVGGQTCEDILDAFVNLWNETSTATSTVSIDSFNEYRQAMVATWRASPGDNVSQENQLPTGYTLTEPSLLLNDGNTYSWPNKSSEVVKRRESYRRYSAVSNYVACTNPQPWGTFCDSSFPCNTPECFCVFSTCMSLCAVTLINEQEGPTVESGMPNGLASEMLDPTILECSLLCGGFGFFNHSALEQRAGSFSILILFNF